MVGNVPELITQRQFALHVELLKHANPRVTYWYNNYQTIIEKPYYDDRVSHFTPYRSERDKKSPEVVLVHCRIIKREKKVSHNSLVDWFTLCNMKCTKTCGRIHRP